jgi:hypothetical protein
VNLEIRRDLVRVQPADSDRTLYALLDAGYRPREIEVSSLGRSAADRRGTRLARLSALLVPLVRADRAE